MKLRVVWCVICLLLLLPRLAGARAVPESEVKRAVETWVREVTAENRPDALVERMEAHVVDGEVRAYVAHLVGGGYCLAGADDLVLPVYFYSPRGRYDSSDPNLTLVLEEIGGRTTAFREAKAESALSPDYLEELARRARSWADLSSGIAPPRVQPEKRAEPQLMDLPLRSQWGQDTPYNEACPTLPVPGSPDQTLVGCVATCLAQIMRYWKWPASGVGSHSVDYQYRWRTAWDEEPLGTAPVIPGSFSGILAWTAANGGRLRMNGTWDDSMYNAARNLSTDTAYRAALDALWARMNVVTDTHSANFAATTYDWSLMPDTCNLPLDSGDLEVAKLSEHLGIAFDMGWGVWFSGSDLWYAEPRLESHFRYDTDAAYGPDDVDIMTQEIQWLRPFAFGGSTGSTAHAWVVFGYNKGTDPNRQFHMNMGWAGASDGWYTLDMVPNNLTNCCTRHLTQIAPQGKVRFIGSSTSGDGSPDNPFRDIDEALQFAPDGSTLIFKAGSTNTLGSGSLVIQRPLELRGHAVTLR